MTGGRIRHLTVSDGYSLAYRTWIPEIARGLVIPIHGIQSHSGWYEYSCSRLAAAGYAVYCADRRGSGQNAVLRGHAAHAMRLLHDVRSLVQLASIELQGQRDSPSAERIPTVLLGISWGGKIAAALAALFPQEVQQLILMYPGLCPRVRPTWIQQGLLSVAALVGADQRPVAVPLGDPGMFTGSRDWQEFIRGDDLALHSVTTGLLNIGRQLDQIVRRNAHQICQPVLLMLAGQDAIIDNRQTRHAINRFGTCSLTTRIYPDARHTLEFEPNREEIFDDLIVWLKLHNRNAGVSGVLQDSASQTQDETAGTEVPEEYR